MSHFGIFNKSDLNNPEKKKRLTLSMFSGQKITLVMSNYCVLKAKAELTCSYSCKSKMVVFKVST